MFNASSPNQIIQTLPSTRISMDPFLLTVSPDFLHKRSESGDRVETLARTSVDSYEALPGCLIAHFSSRGAFCEPTPLIAPSSELQPSPRGAGPSPPSSLLSLSQPLLPCQSHVSLPSRSLLSLFLRPARSPLQPSPLRINDQPCEAEAVSATWAEEGVGWGGCRGVMGGGGGDVCAGKALVYAPNDNSSERPPPPTTPTPSLCPEPLHNPRPVDGIHLTFAASCAITQPPLLHSPQTTEKIKFIRLDLNI